MQRFYTHGPSIWATLAFCLLIGSFCPSGYSQTISLFGVDASQFPAVKAQFYAYDSEGKQLSNLATTDFRITENGKLRTVTNTSCPPVSRVRLSVVLALDVTVYNNLANAKNVLNSWLNLLQLGENEAALMTYDGNSYLNQDFTADKSKLANAIASLATRSSGEDHTGALIRPVTGAISVAQTAKYKPIVIVLSSCSHFNAAREADIVAEAKKKNVTVNFVIFDRYDWTPNLCRNIAFHTNGFSNNHIPYNDLNQAKKSIELIFAKNTSSSPCEIAWISDIECESSREASVECLPIAASTKVNYSVEEQFSTHLLIQPSGVRFKNIAPGSVKDTIISLTAVNSPIAISDISSTLPSVFELLPKNLTLNAGETRQLTLRFSPPDSGMTYARLGVVTPFCEFSFMASGGFRGKKTTVPPIKTIKLEHPNGKEVFVVGEDTTLQWSGVSKETPVRLEYSVDGGKQWKPLAPSTQGSAWHWGSIPRPASNNCLARVRQMDGISLSTAWKWGRHHTPDTQHYVTSMAIDDLGDVIISGYRIGFKRNYFIAKYDWEGRRIWTVGNNAESEIFDMVVMPNGNIAVCGQFTGQMQFTPQTTTRIQAGSATDRDLFWAEFDGLDGKYVGAAALAYNAQYATKTYRIDAAKNIFVSGDFVQDLTVGSATLQNPLGYDIFIAKFNPAGSLNWVQRFGGKLNDEANDLVLGKNGDILVVGSFEDELSVKQGETPTKAQGGKDIVVIALNANSGNVVWSNIVGSTGLDEAHAAISDDIGNFIVNGYYGDKTMFGTTYFDAGGSFLAKYSANGVLQWVNSTRTGNDYFGSGMGVDAQRNVYLTSWLSGEVEFGDNKFVAYGQKDLYVAKYSANGVLQWVDHTNGSYGTTGKNRIVVDKYNEIFVSGNFGGTLHLGDTALNASTWGNNAFLSKYSPDGGNVLQEDESDQTFSIVEPRAQALNVNMGQSFVGAPKAEVAVGCIKNVGPYPFLVRKIEITGADASAFEVVSVNPPYSIAANRDNDMEFSFTPNRLGRHSAILNYFIGLDTLKRTIEGEGVSEFIRVIGSLINMDSVEIGQFKDTVITAALTNVGVSPATIATSADGPNLTDFIAVQGGGAFTLPPGDSVQMTFRFMPSNIGRTSGSVKVEFNGPGSPAYIQLFGLGYIGGKKPSISVASPVFPPLLCDNSATDSILIENIGLDTLAIQSAAIESGTSDFYLMSNINGSKLAPSQTLLLPVLYKPSGLGNAIGRLVIYSNAVNDSAIVVHLQGLKDSVGIQGGFLTSGIQEICMNDSIAYSIAVHNTGNASVEYEIVSDSPELRITGMAVGILPPGKTDSVNTVVVATSPGFRVVKAHVLDRICGKVIPLDIELNVVSPKLIVNNVTIVSTVGVTGIGELTLYNAGNIAIRIDSFPDVSPFVCSFPDLPFTLLPGETYRTTVEYLPLDSNATSISFVLRGDKCSVSNTVVFTGIAAFAFASVGIPDIEAIPGSIVELPIILRAERNLREANVKALLVELHYNSTLLEPLDGSGLVQGNNRIVPLRLPISATSNELARMRFRVGLGDSIISLLTLKAIGAEGGIAALQTESATFTLNGVCLAAGGRLFNPDGKVQLGVPSPNPVGELLTFEIETIEKGVSNLAVFDINGQEIMRIFNGELPIGKRMLQLYVGNFGAGKYTLLLQTPTVSRSIDFIIVR